MTAKEEKTPGKWQVSHGSSAYMQGTLIVKGDKEIAVVWKESDAVHIVEMENNYAALLAQRDALAGALKCAEVGMCAVGVPHAGERAVLQDAVKVVRAALSQQGLK